MSVDEKIKPLVHFQDLGQMDYKACWDLQEGYFQDTVQTKLSNRNRSAEEQVMTTNHLFFVEHPHVYTLGKSGDLSQLLLDEDELQAVDVKYYAINRGCDITYHGPGQKDGLPIIDFDHFLTHIQRS